MNYWEKKKTTQTKTTDSGANVSHNGPGTQTWHSRLSSDQERDSEEKYNWEVIVIVLWVSSAAERWKDQR